MESKNTITSFFKVNSYDIVKLFINQIGITIFSLVLYTAASSIEDDALCFKIKVMLSVFAVVFYFALLYTAAWDFGAKDKIKIDSGKKQESSYKGLKMSVIANSVNVLFALLTVLFSGLFILTGKQGLNSAFAVFNLVLRLGNAMFLGVIQGIFSFLETSDIESKQYMLYYFWQSVGYLVAPVFSVLVTHIGYVFGLKNKKLLGFTGAKSKQK